MPDLFPTTHSTWLVDRLSHAPDEARAHVMASYFEPLCAYARASSLRALGEPAELVNSFLAARLDDHAYLVRTARFTPAPALTEEQLRSEYLVDLRWWSLAELREEPETTFFAPLHLPKLVHDVLVLGVPDEPWQIFQRS